MKHIAASGLVSRCSQIASRICPWLSAAAADSLLALQLDVGGAAGKVLIRILFRNHFF